MLDVTQIGGFGVDPSYMANGIDFDAATDRLSRGAALTGVSDGALMSMSFWAKGASAVGAQNILRSATALAGGTNRIRIDLPAGSGALRLKVSNSGGTDRWLAQTTATVFDGAWHHYAFSVDLAAVTTSKQVYIDDVSAGLTTTTESNGSDGNFGAADWGIAGAPDAANLFDGGLADFMVWFGTKIALSVEANRRCLISPSGKPVNPAVAVAAFGAPQSLLTGEDISTWHTNKGTGGGFTLTGTLTADTRPSA
jgi:hypothetical protein